MQLLLQCKASVKMSAQLLQASCNFVSCGKGINFHQEFLRHAVLKCCRNMLSMVDEKLRGRAGGKALSKINYKKTNTQNSSEGDTGWHETDRLEGTNGDTVWNEGTTHSVCLLQYYL